MTQVTTAPPAPGRPETAGLNGIGLGLRWAFLEEALTAELPPGLAFFELSPENYMRRGGYYPSALERVAARRPLRSHGLMLDIGGQDPLDRAYLEELRSFLDRFDLPDHSDHLCWSRNRGRYLHELLPLAWTRSEAHRIAARLREVAEILERPIAVENISYYADVDQAVDPRREAAFIAEVIEQADCGLLLDVNNVAINALNFDFDPWALITELPLTRVRSLHVAGGQRLAHFDGRLIDTHGSDVDDTVRELMARVVSALGPLPVLYERDNALPTFRQLCEQVETLDAGYREALARAAAPPPTVERLELKADSAFTQAAATDYFLAATPPGVPSGLPHEQASLYRRLVRGALRQPIFDFLERSAARIGSAFDGLVDAWLEDGGSASPYLRDLPDEFLAWLTARSAGATGLPPYILDLMRHELVHYRVASALPPLYDPPEQPFSLAASLATRVPVERIDYAHAVHELPSRVDDRSLPSAREVHLLVYRDADHIVRYLELTPFAAGLIDRLIDGTSVEAALRAQLDAPAGPLPDEALADAGRVLHDLVSRGVIGA